MARGKGQRPKTLQPPVDDSSDKGQTKTTKDKTAKRKKDTKYYPVENATQQGDQEELPRSRRNSAANPHPKKKNGKSQEADNAAHEAALDFWDSAWNICAERFFITSAPITVSCELRNCWLRIIEATWQDRDMHETPDLKQFGIFNSDDPPLPLAFDSWSRGAVESLPGQRRESVMDPFLRDVDTKGRQLNNNTNTVSTAAPSSTTLLGEEAVNQV